MRKGVLAFRLSMVLILFFSLCVLFIGATEPFDYPYSIEALADCVVEGDRMATMSAFYKFERMSAPRGHASHFAPGLIMLGSAIGGFYGSCAWWHRSTTAIAPDA